MPEEYRNTKKLPLSNKVVFLFTELYFYKKNQNRYIILFEILKRKGVNEMAKTRIVSLTLVGVLGLAVATIVTTSLTGNTTTVYVAKSDIATGMKIDSKFFEKVSIPKDGVEPDAILDEKLMLNPKGEYSAYANNMIVKGAQITKTNTSLPGEQNSIVAGLEDGQVAIMLPVKTTNGFTEGVNVGSRISLLATVDVKKTDKASNQTKDSQETIVINENIKVLGLERDKTNNNNTVVGYYIGLPAQQAKDVQHILTAQGDDENRRSVLRVVVTKTQPDGTPYKDIIPRTPIGDLTSRYYQQQ